MTIKVWKDREGKWIDATKFRQRFVKGLEGVTPLQQTKSMLLGYYIVLVGVIWGIVMSAWYKQWWLLTILCGSFIVSGNSTHGTWQKYRNLKKFDDMMKEQAKKVESDF